MLLLPVVVALTSMLVAGGRYAAGHQAVELSAGEAARAASLARTPDQARAEATAVAGQTLASRGVACGTLRVAVEVDEVATPPGRPGVARATVDCTVRVDDLLPLAPGALTLTASAVSPVDTYREARGPHQRRGTRRVAW